MQSCPNCHYKDNPKDSPFCEACGWELLPTSQADVPLEDIEDSFFLEPVPPEFPLDKPDTVTPTDLNLPQPSSAVFVPNRVITQVPNLDPQPISSVPPSDKPIKDQSPNSGYSKSLSGSSSFKAALLIWQRPAHIPPQDFKPQQYVIDRDMMIIGHFDPQEGPVDIDLSLLPGWERTNAQHAQLHWHEDHWNIQDLKSHSGTFVRPRTQTQWLRLTQLTPLNHNDYLSIGPIQFVFQVL